jgi:flavodoxin/Pyruvate/2-oxoacid:ferredoxin oxidoreductase delta subunit
LISLQRIGIFYFSGTGMTKYVVEKLELALAKQQVQVDVLDIAKTHVSSTPLDGYNAIGIAYPVHAFNAPKTVIDFARQLPATHGVDVFVISTPAEYHVLNFDSSKLLIKILRQKGFTVFYDQPFIMPCNFIIKYDDAKVTELINQVNAKMPPAAREITGRVPHRQPSKFLSRFAALAGRLEWLGAKSMSKHYYANENCSNCGLCIYNCPNHNISAGEKSVEFKRQCGLCMRCIYLCPQKAIKVRWPYGFICFGSWYENEELSLISKPEQTRANGHNSG